MQKSKNEKNSTKIIKACMIAIVFIIKKNKEQIWNYIMPKNALKTHLLVLCTCLIQKVAPCLTIFI